MPKVKVVVHEHQIVSHLLSGDVYNDVPEATFDGEVYDMPGGDVVRFKGITEPLGIPWEFNKRCDSVRYPFSFTIIEP
jgi:hypothetical protein